MFVGFQFFSQTGYGFRLACAQTVFFIAFIEDFGNVRMLCLNVTKLEQVVLKRT
jgi:hypothetical protein